MKQEDYYQYDPHFKIHKDYDLEKYGEKFKKYRKRWEENPRIHKTGEFPLAMDLELTRSCNLRCPMCHTLYIEKPSYKAYKDGDTSKFMQFDIFKKAIDEAVQYPEFSSVKLNLRGEPTLHPDFCDFVRYAKDNGVLEVIMNTNGNYDMEAGDIYLSDIDEVAFSIDAVSPEVYKRVRVGGDLYLLYTNIFELMWFQKDYEKKIRIRMSYVEQNLNKHETELFKQFWTAIGVDRITVNDVYNPGDKISGDLGFKLTINKEEYCCPQLWQRLIVMCDGTVWPCCMAFDQQKDLYLGNIKDNSINELWLSNKLMYLRSMHQDGNYQAIKSCNSCPYPKETLG